MLHVYRNTGRRKKINDKNRSEIDGVRKCVDFFKTKRSSLEKQGEKKLISTRFPPSPPPQMSARFPFRCREEKYLPRSYKWDPAVQKKISIKRKEDISIRSAIETSTPKGNEGSSDFEDSTRRGRGRRGKGGSKARKSKR